MLAAVLDGRSAPRPTGQKNGPRRPLIGKPTLNPVGVGFPYARGIFIKIPSYQFS
jgi:hypothetical protein